MGGHHHIPPISCYGVGSSREGDRLATAAGLPVENAASSLRSWPPLKARYTIAFLLEMQNLPAAAKSDIMSGAHVCRHSDGCESVSADQVGEQIYIRQSKGAGGLKGISTNGDQVAVWVASFPICSQLIDTVE